MARFNQLYCLTVSPSLSHEEMRRVSNARYSGDEVKVVAGKSAVAGFEDWSGPGRASLTDMVVTWDDANKTVLGFLAESIGNLPRLEADERRCYPNKEQAEISLQPIAEHIRLSMEVLYDKQVEVEFVYPDDC